MIVLMDSFLLDPSQLSGRRREKEEAAAAGGGGLSPESQSSFSC